MNIEDLNKEEVSFPIIPFEERPITTMVAVCTIHGSINIYEAFTMLPIHKITIPDTMKNKKVIQLPHPGIPGAILSMRYKEEVRGIILKSFQSDHFKNSITIDMSIREKIVNFRLSSETIHVCGVKSFNQIHEMSTLLLNHFKTIQDDLDYIQGHLKETKDCVSYIRYNIKKDKDKIFVESSKDVDPRIFKFCLRNIEEHIMIKNFLFELEWILVKTKIYNEDPYIEIPQTSLINIIRTSMINLNYSIGFQIDRRSLYVNASKYPNFYATYDNSINHSVKIMLPFTIKGNDNIRRKEKKGELSFHTFMVYKSGCVTQSGPSLELMKIAYYDFFNMINKIKYSIIKKPRIVIINNQSHEVFDESSKSSSSSTKDSIRRLFLE